MEISWNLPLILAAFGMVALAARQFGRFFVRFRLPLISGYLVAGILAGPFVLMLVSQEAAHELLFLEEISLAFIAFAAGSELYLPELRGRLRSIGTVTGGLVIATFTGIVIVVLLLGDAIPFMNDLSRNGRWAVAILAGAIMTARSPSSAIAIVNELRAKGPFTQVALGVTVIMDVVVITLFAISASLADVLLTDQPLRFSFIFILMMELLITAGIAYLLYHLLNFLLSIHLNRSVKTGLILLAGFSIFLLTGFIREMAHNYLHLELLLEPLLICLIASFLVNNYSKNRTEFIKIIHDAAPLIYVMFFTLVGTLLELDILVQTWAIALALFATRLGAIMIGSFSGGVIARDPMRYNRLKWMAFVTQAGVALGLAEEVAVEFPELGTAFATMIISVVVINEIIGPFFFKHAINRIGEARTRAETAEFDGVQDAIIFGVEDQALALARQLRSHNWDVKVACLDGAFMSHLTNSDLQIQPISDISLTGLAQLDAQHADAIVALLSDEENYRICELAYEHFGTKTMVVRLNDLANFERFHELGVLIVDPNTAMVGLMEQFVRSPTAASLLLGMDAEQGVLELELRDPNLDGVALRDLRLPLDTLILSVRRNGHTIITHGYTQLELGDRVTVVGSPQSLEAVNLRFSE